MIRQSTNRWTLFGASVALALLVLSLTPTTPYFHETVAAHPNWAALTVDSGALTFEGATAGFPLARTCGEGGQLLVTSYTRPMVVLCAGHWGFPVFTVSYSSGLLSWPSAVFSVVGVSAAWSQRIYSVLVGIFGLWLVRRLVRRFDGEQAATTAVLMVASSSAFLATLCIGADYEVLGPLCFVGAVLVGLSPSVEGKPQRRGLRSFAAGLLLGVGLLTNLKTILFFPPAALVLLRRRGLRDLTIRNLFGLTSGLALSTVPMALLTASGGNDVGSNVAGRLSRLFAEWDGWVFVREGQNLVTNWSDFFHYFDLATGQQRGPALGLMVFAAFSTLYCAVRAARFVWTGKGSEITAFCGLLLVEWYVFSVVLYHQYPAANYAPVGVVFGLAGASTLRAGAGLMARLAGRPETPRVAFGILLLVVVQLSLWPAVRRLDGATIDNAHLDLRAQLALLDAVDEREDGDETYLVTFHYNLRGVFDALSAGHIRQLHAGNFLSSPLTRNSPDPRGLPHAEQVEYFAIQWRRLFVSWPESRMYVVVPARELRIDGRMEPAMSQAFFSVVESRGADLELLLVSESLPDSPALSLYEVREPTD